MQHMDLFSRRSAIAAALCLLLALAVIYALWRQEGSPARAGAILVTREAAGHAA